jgi:TonB family protein
VRDLLVLLTVWMGGFRLRAQTGTPGSLLQAGSPLYPLAAKAAGIEGKVVLKGTIDTDGHMKNLQVVKGPAELRQAAMDAVMRWTFRPRRSARQILVAWLRRHRYFRWHSENLSQESESYRILPCPTAKRLNHCLIPDIARPQREARPSQSVSSIVRNRPFDPEKKQTDGPWNFRRSCHPVQRCRSPRKSTNYQ